MRFRIYTDTSVLGGCEDEEFADVGRVDVLVSWNFKHIVNLQRIHGYNSVNLREGYPMIETRTPREVVSDE